MAKTKTADADPVEKKPATQGNTGLVLGSPEWNEFMQERRRLARERREAEAVAAGGGKATREAAKESAMERLVPRAIKVLEAQMKGEPCACPNCEHVIDVPDFKLQQSAAVKVLEWGKGKPRQTIENVGEQVQIIRYETAALGDAGAN